MAKGKASSSDKTMSLILGVVIIVVLAVGVFAVYGKISDDAFKKSVENGTAPQTVATLARQEGQSVDEFLKSYDMTDGTINGDSSQEDFYNNMSVEKYAAYQGSDFDTFISQNGLEGKVEKTTKMSDAKKLIPLGKYIGIDASAEGAADQFAQFKTTYGLGANVTLETPWGEVEETVMAAQEAMQNATPAPAADASAAPAADAASAPAASPAANAASTPAAQ